MLNYLKNESNRTYTENGAATFKSTQSDCLDFFATAGALRSRGKGIIIKRFQRAFAEDRDLAMRALFFTRDVRGGLGERRVFRTILHYLALTEPASVIKNIPFIAEYGRWDDLLTLLYTRCEAEAIRCIKEQLGADLAALQNGETVSLLAKWLPSVNASNAEARQFASRIAQKLGMSDAKYRKTLASLRAYLQIVENNLRTKDYSFDYSKQPSQAMLKYRRAFLRNDGERYNAFLDAVKNGTAAMHADTLVPYDIIRPIIKGNPGESERKVLDVTWNAQTDVTGDDNALVVVDGSGSMYGDGARPIAVAESLAIYFAERNTGAFHNHFITFSEHPQLVAIKGSDIYERVRYCMGYNECANTNIQKVFELVLETALTYNVPQSELPSTLYIISDMEFDCCAEDASITNFEYARKLYKSYGYELPQLVFWNVDSRNCQQPVTKNEQGVALVSGCSPVLFSLVQSGELSPIKCMLNILNSERYREISA